MTTRVSGLLQSLHLSERNLGTCTGPEWLETTGKWIPSYDPSSGDVIAYVQEADDAA